ncbi:uncharacterized protein EDB93DRAFT_1254558 [Suillus bovinus]|uniref:uncharacterized protein n=1 Tax=Suillus bovinus TaxID=48563 RepID=UPI001B87AFE4|nr:uncharacterized protein EDB93DRAFT_1254558 [Suillus bovinus]KAG2134443.1 hypothetical protein EDB93DRAFT_1254558 [Suillus bovinus]
MSLRRFAQANNAANTPGTPISLSPRPNGAAYTPVTPRPRVSYVQSPSSTPSISSSTPFDWDAARSRRPPPYASPLSAKRKSRMSTVPDGLRPLPKKVVKKKGIFEKITALPSQIMFEISLFPHNVPMPAPKTTGWLIGSSMHLLHLCLRVSQIRATADSDIGWEDLYWERSQQSWFDWTVPMTGVLLVASTLNAMHLFTQSKTYRLHRRTKADPVSSPHTTFVTSPARARPLSSDEPSEMASFQTRILRVIKVVIIFLWTCFISFWKFLLGISTPTPSSSSPARGAPADQIQQLEVWTPGELERILLSVYSPVHALIWMSTGPTNWMLMTAVMGAVGVQTSLLIQSYEGLVKDRAILAAEVMHEYNEGFVYPRMNVVKKDVAVMTHQSEMINIWED